MQKLKIKEKLAKLSQIKIKKSLFLKISLITVGTVSLFTFIFIILTSFLNSQISLDTSKIILKSQASHSKNEAVNLDSAIPLFKGSENPINGVFITDALAEEIKQKDVYLVTINNHPKARPQSGLSQADMVMEVLTEGGITRYVGVFYGEKPEKIGPVRSVRRYMVDFLGEFDDPILLHEGGASFHGHEGVYVRETDALRDINQYDVKSMQSANSRYRDSAKIKSAGYVHALYTSYALIEKGRSSYPGWDAGTNMEKYDAFKFDEPLDQRGNVSNIRFSFLSTANSISAAGFDYNQASNSYDRYILSKPDFDESTGRRISPKNVIIEWHDYRPANDTYSRIVIGMIGEGKVQIFRDGKVIEGKWKKTSRTDRTKYYDDKGNLIELNRGQLWKVVLLKNSKGNVSTLSYE